MRMYLTTSFGTGLELLEQTRVHEISVSHSPSTPTPPIFEGKESILLNTSQSWIDAFSTLLFVFHAGKYDCSISKIPTSALENVVTETG
jgi:hypothetical protein